MVTHSSILPGESHGQRSLVGCSPWGLKESDTTEHLTPRDRDRLSVVVPEGIILVNFKSSCYCYFLLADE